MKDNANLQVLQNKLNKLLTNSDYNTPTVDLLEQTDALSVHQMIAYQTGVATYKVVKSGKPSYIASKLKVKQTNPDTRQGAGTVQVPRYKRNIAREGFVYRGAQLYNKLDGDLRAEPKLEKFKTGLRKWVKTNIAVKPKPKFASILDGRNRRQQPHLPPEPPDAPPRQNLITRYFAPYNPNH